MSTPDRTPETKDLVSTAGKIRAAMIACLEERDGRYYATEEGRKRLRGILDMEGIQATVSIEGQVNARRHFGFDIHATPGCIEKLTAPERSLLRIRAYQEDDRRRLEEDTELHRQIARMQADHAVALRRAEEKGYASGLKDAHQHGMSCSVSRSYCGEDGAGS